MTRQIRVTDLPETHQHGVYLYRPGCHGQYSADRRDYFMSRPDTVMKCGGKGHGGPTRNLLLVCKTTIIEEM